MHNTKNEHLISSFCRRVTEGENEVILIRAYKKMLKASTTVDAQFWKFHLIFSYYIIYCLNFRILKEIQF